MGVKHIKNGTKHTNEKKWFIIYDFLTCLDLTTLDIANKYNMAQSTVCILTDRYFALKTNLRTRALELGNPQDFADEFKNIQL